MGRRIEKKWEWKGKLEKRYRKKINHPRVLGYLSTPAPCLTRPGLKYNKNFVQGSPNLTSLACD